jgi:hypothetical protein
MFVCRLIPRDSKRFASRCALRQRNALGGTPGRFCFRRFISWAGFPMALAGAIAARFSLVQTEISSPLERATSGAADGVERNPAAQRNREHAPLALFLHRQFLLPFRGIKTHGGPLRSEHGRLQRACRGQFVPGSTVTPKPDDDWMVRGPGLVFSREEGVSSSVWLMKLPH